MLKIVVFPAPRWPINPIFIATTPNLELNESNLPEKIGRIKLRSKFADVTEAEQKSRSDFGAESRASRS